MNFLRFMGPRPEGGCVKGNKRSKPSSNHPPSPARTTNGAAASAAGAPAIAAAGDEEFSCSHHDSQPLNLHQSMLRERPKRHRFDQIYEILDDIGNGGLCKIYKIRKRYDQVGGSSRGPRRRRASSFLLKFSQSINSKSAVFNPALPASPTANNHKHYNHDPSSSNVQVEPQEPQALLYALKVINLKLVKGGDEKIDQLYNEVELLKTLDHKNIIKAYETVQMKDTKQLAIVMELCTGGDLYARLPYTEREVASVTKQILSAISYLHDRNIIHRDIKMENIVFESRHPDAAIKVIDFGLSKKYSVVDSVLKERVGTLYSMSPETMQGNYTYQADLWSIGVCSFIMLCGEKPFEGKTPKQLVAKVLMGAYAFDPALWDQISVCAKDFIQKLLVVKPEERLTAQQAIRHAWFDSLKKVPSIDDFEKNELLKQRVREGIVRYANMGEFRKLALNVIAKKSSADEIFELRQVFDEFDTMHTGTITLDEFRNALAKFNYSEDELVELFRKVDVNRSNEINYTEFLAAALETQGTIAEYRLAEAFDLMDSDDSGYISRENLRDILGTHADEQYIDRLISEADFKKDGKISYEEFLQMFEEEMHDRIYDMYEVSSELQKQTPLMADEVLKTHGIAVKAGFRSSSFRRLNKGLSNITDKSNTSNHSHIRKMSDVSNSSSKSKTSQKSK